MTCSVCARASWLFRVPTLKVERLKGTPRNLLDDSYFHKISTEATPLNNEVPFYPPKMMVSTGGEQRGAC